MIGTKPLRMRLHKIAGFITDYHGTKYLVLFGREKNDTIYDKFRYRISQMSGIAFVFSHSYARIKIDSFDFLPLECYNTHYASF